MTPRHALRAASVLLVMALQAGGAIAQVLPLPAPQPPPGQDAPDPAKLQAFSNTPYYKALVRRAIASVPPQIFNRCPSLVSTIARFSLIEPIRYADDGFPIAGVWKEAFPVSGCGPDTILNFFFVAKADHMIDTVIGLPGTTHADPVLQHDAQAIAVAAALRIPPAKGAAPCATYGIKNTAFQSFGLETPLVRDPGPTEPRRPWWEVWSVDGCGRTVTVPLNFVPEANRVAVAQTGRITQQPSLYQSQAAPGIPGAPPVAAASPALNAPAAPASPSPSALPAAAPTTPLPAPAPIPAPARTAATVVPLPGTSHAGPTLQQRAQAEAIGAAVAALQIDKGTPCPDYTITNTRFDAYGLADPPTPDPGPAAPDRPWNETWTASGCGRNFLVPLNFIPADGRTSIVQPGHVTQALLIDPSQIPRSPYAKDDPPEPSPPGNKP